MDVGGTPIPMLTLDNILLSSSLPSTSSWLPSLATEQFGHDQSQVPLDIDWISLLSGCEENPSSSSATARDGDKNNEGGNSTKKVAKAKKSTPRRIAFHTKSADDILDDGYRWRKYGQKAVKNSSHPRSYYRCVHHTCNVKKQIQRLSKDPGIVVTTYEGTHNHPCEKLMETLAPLLKQLQFLSRI